MNWARGGVLGGRQELQFPDRLDLGDVEGGLHPQGCRQPQTDRRYVDHLVHLERTNKPVSQLAGLHTERDVLG